MQFYMMESQLQGNVEIECCNMIRKNTEAICEYTLLFPLSMSHTKLVIFHKTSLNFNLFVRQYCD